MNGVATEASQRYSRCCRSENGCHRAAATPTAAASAAAHRSWKQATGNASRGTSSVPMAQRLPKRRMAGMVLKRGKKTEREGKKRNAMPVPDVDVDRRGVNREQEREERRREREVFFLLFSSSNELSLPLFMNRMEATNGILSQLNEHRVGVTFTRKN